jgi:hypothetical protein
MRGVTAFVNGKQMPVQANLCPNQLVRVAVQGSPGSSVLVDREHQKVFAPVTDFYEVFGFVFTRDIDPVGVSFENRVKIERDTELRFFEVDSRSEILQLGMKLS